MTIAMLHLQEHPVPAWYELSYADGAILVDIHPAAWDEVRRFSQAVVQQGSNGPARSAIKVEPYQPPGSATWGYGGCLEMVPSPLDMWHRVRAALPKAPEPGPGARLWEPVFALSFSLEILLSGLEMRQGGHSSLTQLMTVHLDSSQRSPELRAHFSQALCTHLAVLVEPVPRQSYMEIGWITEEMRRLYGMMFRTGSFHPQEFRAAVLRPRNLYFMVAEGCELGTDKLYDLYPGYVLHPHKANNPFQQLTLLAGLACLSRQVRETGLKSPSR
jgi:hypothetical protein